jgi:hypothetical protein
MSETMCPECYVNGIVNCSVHGQVRTRPDRTTPQPTPRSDEEVRYYEYLEGGTINRHNAALVSHEFACQLERELATEQKENWTASLCDRVNEFLREHPAAQEVSNGEQCSYAISALHGYAGSLKTKLAIAEESLKKVFCPWCQTTYEKGEDLYKAVMEHLNVCLAHPIKRAKSAEAENAELKDKINGACVWLQGGSDVEAAAEKMFETNQSNQREVIRLYDESAELKARLDWLNTPEGMDWFSHCDYGQATLEAIDSARLSGQTKASIP